MITTRELMKTAESLWIVNTPIGIWVANPPFWFIPAKSLGLDSVKTGLYKIDNGHAEFIRPQGPKLNWLTEYKGEDIEVDDIPIIVRPNNKKLALPNMYVSFNKGSIVTSDILREFIVKGNKKPRYMYVKEEKRIVIRENWSNDIPIGILGIINIKFPECDICHNYAMLWYYIKGHTITRCQDHQYLELLSVTKFVTESYI